MTKRLEKYYFIGIGGIGMSALAHILLDKKFLVSGSDLSLSETTEGLVRKGAVVRHGHSAKYLSPNDTVIYGSGIPENHPEFQAAQALKCPMLHRSELLSRLMGGYETLAITGTHGKTTTTALLTAVLIEGGCDPTYAIGGKIQGLNGKLGRGKYFVAEADESDGTFLKYKPEGAIVTNIGEEHLEYFKTKETLQGAFKTFFKQVKNRDLLFYCGDTISHEDGICYGFGQNNALRIENFHQEGWEIHFDVVFEGKIYPKIVCPLVGEHNALNAAAVFGLALKLGIAEEKIRHAMKNFPGVERRCQKKGEVGDVLFLDDYAHHPIEIEKTLKGVKHAIEERRLVVVFQPHRYTRTREQLSNFGTVFENADFVYVTDIYSASEKPISGIDAESVLQQLRQHSTVPCAYLPRNRVSQELKNSLQTHDVLLTLGAGDITHLHSEVLKDFIPKKLVLGLIFGGLSCEHEISLRSSRFVADSLNSKLYEILYFGIDKRGEWVCGEEAQELFHSPQPVVASQTPHSVLDPEVTRELQKCDLFVPILHGPNGEDGSMQGFFEMLQKPYLGPDYRSAAISMDKVLTKRLVRMYGVKTPKELNFGHLRWINGRQEIIEEICTQLQFPLYVKPVHLGSSVGITCVREKEHLEEAIELAFHFDTQVMIEEGKLGCRELEFAVTGNSHGFRILVPPPGEKLGNGEFVDYEKKYSQHAIEMTVEAELDPLLLKKGQELALKVYEAIGCSGMARVDFLLDEKEGEYWFFEINPIPGLTPLSLFPKIWKREGITTDRLLDRLIILALQRHRSQRRHYKCLNF